MKQTIPAAGVDVSKRFSDYVHPCAEQRHSGLHEDLP